MDKSISIADLFWTNVPREYMELMLKVALQAYPQGYRSCRERHDWPEARSLVGHEIRAIIQRQMRDAASRFPKVMLGEINDDNFVTHSKVTSGMVVMTANSAPTPDTLIKASEARKEYAQYTIEEQQVWHFARTKPRNTHTLFATFLHGRGHEKFGKLGFAVVRFPNQDFTGYYAARIDLMAEFPQVVAEFTNSFEPHIENIPDDLTIETLDTNHQGKEATG
jgi:hypothetical protein